MHKKKLTKKNKPKQQKKNKKNKTTKTTIPPTPPPQKKQNKKKIQNMEVPIYMTSLFELVIFKFYVFQFCF